MCELAAEFASSKASARSRYPQGFLRRGHIPFDTNWRWVWIEPGQLARAEWHGGPEQRARNPERWCTGSRGVAHPSQRRDGCMDLLCPNATQDVAVGVTN
jgi:hypothetical protein